MKKVENLVWLSLLKRIRKSHMTPRSMQGWAFAHSLIAHSLICSFYLLKSNERLWAIRSDRSRQMSYRERIAHDKWATVSDSLRLFMINGWMSKLLKKCWLKKYKIFFSVCFIYVFLFTKWVIRSFPLFKWAMWANPSGRSPKMSDVSESLRPLTKNERPWAIRSGRS